MGAVSASEQAATSAPHPLTSQVLELVGPRTGACWVVGGYVRDMLMGRPTHDLDLVVEDGAVVLARAIADRFGGAFYALDEGRDIGRAILPGTQPALTVDVSRLQGCDLRSDLAQRDFTINAMAMPLPLREKPPALVDFHGGSHDIAARRVRAVRESAFRDDPVRCLRAVRFAVELGFEIEEQTRAWVGRDGPLVLAAAPERVRVELVRILDARGADDGLRQMSQLGLLPTVLPEVADTQGLLQSLPHTLDVFDHTVLTVRQLGLVLQAAAGEAGAGTSAGGRGAGEPAARLQTAAALTLSTGLQAFRADLRRHLDARTSASRSRGVLLRWAALLHDVGKPKTRTVEPGGRVRFFEHDVVGADLAAGALRRLRFNREEVRWVETIVRQHMRPSALAREPMLTQRAVYRFFRDAGAAGVDTCLLALADHLATWGQNLDLEHWAVRVDCTGRLFDSYFHHATTQVSPRPLLGGLELREGLGLEAGPAVGFLLEALREAQAAGEVSTPEEAWALVRQLAAARAWGTSG